jgi:uncharacterized coiled-coil protein SlyX
MENPINNKITEIENLIIIEEILTQIKEKLVSLNEVIVTQRKDLDRIHPKLNTLENLITPLENAFKNSKIEIKNLIESQQKDFTKKLEKLEKLIIEKVNVPPPVTPTQEKKIKSEKKNSQSNKKQTKGEIK